MDVEVGVLTDVDDVEEAEGVEEGVSTDVVEVDVEDEYGVDVGVSVGVVEVELGT